MSQEVKKMEENKDGEVVSEQMIKDAEELVNMLNTNKELREKLKEIDQNVELMKYIVAELKTLYDLRRKTVLFADDIAKALSVVKYTARVEIIVDAKDIALFGASGTLLLKLPFGEASNLTVSNLLMKIVENDEPIRRLYKRLMETLDEMSRDIADKFDLIEKINIISSWIEENDP